MIRIVSLLLLIAGCIFALYAGYAIAEADYIPLSLVILVGIGLVFVMQPALSCAFVLCLYHSGVTMPGLPGKLTLFYVAALFLFGVYILQIAFKRLPLPQFETRHILAGAFAAVVLITIAFRGFGFSIFGGDRVGGMFYVQHFISLILFFIVPVFVIPAAWWPRVLLAMGLASLLPMLSELLVMVNMQFSWVWMFVQGDSSILGNWSPSDPDFGMARFRSAGPAGVYLLMSLLAYVHTRRFFEPGGFIPWVLLTACGVLMLLGGYRSRIIIFAGIFLMVCIFQRTATFGKFILLLVAMGMAWGTLVLLGPSLPGAIQRAISAIPGASVDYRIASEADSTIDWRLVLWRHGLSVVPDYLWIGKGLTYSSEAVLEGVQAADYEASLRWAVESVSYHNGPLSVIIAFGLAGLLVTLALFYHVLRRHIPMARGTWRHPPLQLCHQVILATLVVQIAFFVTLYGDAQASFADLFYYWAILEALRVADQRDPVTTPARAARAEADTSLYSEAT